MGSELPVTSQGEARAGILALWLLSPGSNEGDHGKPALPTLHSALDPASHEIVGVSRAGKICSPSTGGQRGGLRTDQGTTEATSRASCQEEQGSSQESRGPINDSFIQQIFSEHLPHARHCANAEDTTLRKTDKVPVPKALTFLWGRQWPTRLSPHDNLGNEKDY